MKNLNRIIRIVVLVVIMMGCSMSIARAQIKVQAQRPQTPVLLDRKDNTLFNIRIDAPQRGIMESLTLNIDPQTAKYVKSLKLYYAGSDAADVAADKMISVDYIRDGKRMADSSLSILKDKARASSVVTLQGDVNLFPGINYFWVSVEMCAKTPLTHKVKAEIAAVKVSGQDYEPVAVGHLCESQRVGIGVRHAGDDDVAAYRIPGLVTTSEGTLLCVYDVRYNSSRDLQGRIDIGLSRSTDGGQTWERMRLPLHFGEWGGLPSAQNGVGDPAILYDPVMNRTWIIAVWCHGMGSRMAWHATKPGMTPYTTGQLVLAYSDDDGRSWSEPINITEQVKLSDWNFVLQGPGRGIAMQDGTLVFPFQHHEGTNKMPSAGIIYSKDHGRTWHLHNWARENTTEAQVVELPSGELMLNMRDNRGGSRAVSTTSDFGRTWVEHPSSRKVLREPVCMASLIAVRAEDNVSGRNILLFSNPDDEKDRKNMTIKISFDNGLTWPRENQVLLDEDSWWGYSCLTMIDDKTVGILYECSQAHMVFQAVPLSDLLK